MAIIGQDVIEITAVDNASRQIGQVEAALNRQRGALKSTSKEAEVFQTSERKVETITKVLGQSLFTTAQSGFRTSTAFASASSAVGFLGNALGNLTTPIGLVITVGGALVASILALISTQEKHTEITKESSEVLNLYSGMLKAAKDGMIELTKEEKAFIKAKLERAAEEKTDVENKKSLTEALNKFTIAAKKHEEVLKEIDIARAAVNAGNYEAGRSIKELEIVEKDYSLILQETKKEYDDLVILKAKGKKVAIEAAIGEKQAQKEIAEALSKVEDELYEMEVRKDAIKEELFQRDQKRMEEEYQKALLIQDAILKKEEETQKAKLLLEQQTQAASFALVSNVFKLMGTLGEENFELQKGIAYAQAIINTAEAVTKALTGSPPPANYIAAAATAVAGAAQIATIAATTPGTAGGGITTPSGAGGGGGYTGGGGEFGGGGGGGGYGGGSYGGGGGGYGGGGPISIYMNFTGPITRQFVKAIIELAQKEGMISVYGKGQQLIIGGGG